MEAVIFFTKIPGLGYSKSRLKGFLSDQEILDLSKNMIEYNYQILKNSDIDHYIFYASKKNEDRKDLFPDSQMYPQEGNNLGERMYKAIKALYHKGYRKIILLGSDVYGMSVDLLDLARKKLGDHSLVVSPTQDGGYSLIGLDYPYKDLFSGKVYSHDQVFHDLIESAKDLKLTYYTLPQTKDLDDGHDLMVHLSDHPNPRLLQVGPPLIFQGGRKKYLLGVEEGDISRDPFTGIRYVAENLGDEDE